MAMDEVDFEIKGSVPTAQQAEPWLVEGLAQVVLVIPEGYGTDLNAGRSPNLQVLADGTDANSAVVGENSQRDLRPMKFNLRPHFLPGYLKMRLRNSLSPHLKVPWPSWPRKDWTSTKCGRARCRQSYG